MEDDIKAITSDPVKVVFDAIGSPETQNAAYGALSSGGTLVVVIPLSIPEEKLRDDKKALFTYAVLQEEKNLSSARALYKNITKLLEGGDIKVCVLCLINSIVVLIDG